MFFEKGFWYVYVYYVRSLKKYYIGTKRGHGDYYYSSSTDVALKQAIKDGEAECYILFKIAETEENAESRAYALETYSISLAVEYGLNLYNKNAGGGFGTVDLSVLLPEDKTIAEKLLIEGEFPKTFDVSDFIVDRDKIYSLAVTVHRSVKDYLDKIDNPYVPKWYNIDTAMALPFRQIRDKSVIREHVVEIKTRMERETEEETRRITRPLSVIVHDNGFKEAVNGVHTVHAKKELNRDPYIAVVEIPFSAFNYDYNLVELYATFCNDMEEVTSRGVDTKKELRLRLKTFYESNRDLSEFEFREKFAALYAAAPGKKGGFSKSEISANLTAFLNKIEEETQRGGNWIDYRNYRDKNLLKHIKTIAGNLFGTQGCTAVSVAQLKREGFLNPHIYLQENQYETTSVVLAHHTSVDSEKFFNSNMSQLHSMFIEYGWVQDKSKTRYGMTPYTYNGKLIYVYELPCRHDTIDGTTTKLARKICSMIFVDE